MGGGGLLLEGSNPGQAKGRAGSHALKASLLLAQEIGPHLVGRRHAARADRVVHAAVERPERRLRARHGGGPLSSSSLLFRDELGSRCVVVCLAFCRAVVVGVCIASSFPSPPPPAIRATRASLCSLSLSQPQSVSLSPEPLTRGRTSGLTSLRSGNFTRSFASSSTVFIAWPICDIGLDDGECCMGV